MPPLDELVDDDVLDEVEELVEEDVDVELVVPKLDEVTPPDEVDVEVDVDEVDGVPPEDVECAPPEELDDEEEDDEEDELELDEEVVEELISAPPVDVEVDDPPDPPDPPEDVLEEPPVLEVEPPLVEVEPPLLVEETTTLPPLLPPPLPPKNPPKKPPPPKPPLPPTKTGPPPLPPMGGNSAIGGMGSGVVVVVTVALPQVVTVRATRRLTLRTGAWRACARTGAFTRCVGAWCGRSAMWTAPPPTIAPPQAHAHNLAKAIRTDIATTLHSNVSDAVNIGRSCIGGLHIEAQIIGMTAMALTFFRPLIFLRGQNICKSVSLMSRIETRGTKLV